MVGESIYFIFFLTMPLDANILETVHLGWACCLETPQLAKLCVVIIEKYCFGSARDSY